MGFFSEPIKWGYRCGKNIQTKIVTIKIKIKQKKNEKIVTIGQIPYALSVTSKKSMQSQWIVHFLPKFHFYLFLL